MGKKDLSQEDRRLWQLYTRNIKPTSFERGPAEERSQAQPFKINALKEATRTKFTQPSVSNFDSLKNNDSNWGKKLKAGKVRPDGKIDLHGMTCVEAHEKLYHYLERAQRNQKRVVLVVTGKGGPKKTGYADFRYTDFENSRGVLRREVPLWLSSGAMRHMIVSFQDARQSDGGTGALYVVLKRT
jgi:DNA-nicking Smr family endonuclease|tara:strand:- start:40127 stop:40681 length:555 start_codon:yes stop_codon:yes gene_type:complete